jgi:hypothetical protein
MSPFQRLGAVVLAVLLLASPAHLLAGGSVTFTSDASGTFGNALQYDNGTRELTVDLPAALKDAGVFRAELTLRGLQQFQVPTTDPTTVYPVGEPEKKLSFVAPACNSLDCLDAVKAALAAGKPLKLTLQTTLSGPGRLEVSYSGRLPNVRLPEAGKVAGLKVAHRKGQSMITFAEPALKPFPEFATGKDVAEFRAELLKAHPGVTFHVWRSAERITPATIGKARSVPPGRHRQGQARPVPRHRRWGSRPVGHRHLRPQPAGGGQGVLRGDRCGPGSGGLLDPGRRRHNSRGGRGGRGPRRADPPVGRAAREGLAVPQRAADQADLHPLGELAGFLHARQPHRLPGGDGR